MSPFRIKPGASDTNNLRKFLDPAIREVSKIPPDFPLMLLIGDFIIIVETLKKTGSWNRRRRTASGVSGTGWLSFGCGGLPQLSIGAKVAKGHFRVKSFLEVVSYVGNPQTEISLENARLIKPDISLGENLEVELDLSQSELQGLLQTEYGIVEHLLSRKGDVRVEFKDVTIRIVDSENRIGRIIRGNAVYPTDSPRYPGIIKLAINGFTVLIDSLTVSPKEAIANLVVQLPRNIASEKTCRTATLNLGKTAITPDCRFYVEKPDEPFGPWIVGDTGMIASGNGFIADFHSSLSPLSKAASWKGIVLKNGEASGQKISPTNSNTGFITGKYSFTNAIISNRGIEAEFNLEEKHTFQTLHPINYTISFGKGKLNISESRVVSGFLGQGQIALPVESIHQEPTRNTSKASFSFLTIQNDLDIAGEVDLGNLRNAWGELTHRRDEVVAWSAEMNKGYIYLPSRPTPNFSPDTGAGFLALSMPYQVSDALAYLESEGVAGVSVVSPDRVKIYSPDRPGGETNPIELQNLIGWLRIGSHGVDGELFVQEMGGDQELGNIRRAGYVGREPFSSRLYHPRKKRLLLGQFVSSAVFDSGIFGSIKLSPPCNMELDFADMEITSTANLVGGDIVLPASGVDLDYWKLQLVPTENPDKAGVISVRTGRLIFTAAGISEPVHFAQPFGLTWGEILADGNIGELFFDYNNYGQRFDGFQFSPHHIHLSKYTSSSSDAYLSTCGTISFNFFGEYFVNIKDARYDANLAGPHFGRLVTVPKQGEAACQKTDLHLHGEWNNSLVVFDFPDANVKYNDTIQDGFIGKGTTGIDFIQSDGLSAQIELRGDVIDISLSTVGTHDLDFDLFARLGGMSGISGCVRIEGPTLKQFTINGYLEFSAATGFGIISPRAGYVVEALLSITPTSCTFMASGDMLLAISGASVDISGSIYLSVDYARHSAEGDFLGRIDCSSILGGLEGEGQVTWFIDPNIQYLQGRITMEICGWSGETGFEGGLFIGKDVPRDKAWVLLYTGSEHFGISEGILPSTLTGLYGYGRLSASINLYIVSGGFELFAGMGAFTQTPPGLSSLWPVDWSSIQGLGLPYVVGSCGIHIHGEILGGLVSASAWANLDLRGPVPLYFEGKVGLEGCVLWVFCKSIEITAGFDSGGFYARL